MGRYISNSLFIDLASGGWIGTSGSRSDFLKDVIRDILISKRSLLLAIKTSIPDVDGDGDDTFDDDILTDLNYPPLRPI